MKLSSLKVAINPHGCESQENKQSQQIVEFSLALLSGGLSVPHKHMLAALRHIRVSSVTRWMTVLDTGSGNQAELQLRLSGLSLGQMRFPTSRKSQSSKWRHVAGSDSPPNAVLQVLPTSRRDISQTARSYARLHRD